MGECKIGCFVIRKVGDLIKEYLQNYWIFKKEKRFFAFDQSIPKLDQCKRIAKEFMTRLITSESNSAIEILVWLKIQILDFVQKLRSYVIQMMTFFELGSSSKRLSLRDDNEFRINWIEFCIVGLEIDEIGISNSFPCQFVKWPRLDPTIHRNETPNERNFKLKFANFKTKPKEYFRLWILLQRLSNRESKKIQKIKCKLKVFTDKKVFSYEFSTLNLWRSQQVIKYFARWHWNCWFAALFLHLSVFFIWQKLNLLKRFFYCYLIISKESIIFITQFKSFNSFQSEWKLRKKLKNILRPLNVRAPITQLKAHKNRIQTAINCVLPEDLISIKK